MMQVTKVWWDGEKLMAKPIDPAAIYKEQQPAQPQQEPVAWLDPWTRNNVTTDYDAYGKHGIPLYTSPSPSAQHKPFVWLTDEEIKKSWPNTRFDFSEGVEDVLVFARAIEAKLERKNT